MAAWLSAGPMRVLILLDLNNRVLEYAAQELIAQAICAGFFSDRGRTKVFLDAWIGSFAGMVRLGCR